MGLLREQEPEPHFDWGGAEVKQHATVIKLDLQLPLRAAHDVADLFGARARPGLDAAYTSIEVVRHGGQFDYAAYVAGVKPASTWRRCSSQCSPRSTSAAPKRPTAGGSARTAMTLPSG